MCFAARKWWSFLVQYNKTGELAIENAIHEPGITYSDPLPPPNSAITPSPDHVTGFSQDFLILWDFTGCCKCETWRRGGGGGEANYRMEGWKCYSGFNIKCMFTHVTCNGEVWQYPLSCQWMETYLHILWVSQFLPWILLVEISFQ